MTGTLLAELGPSLSVSGKEASNSAQAVRKRTSRDRAFQRNYFYRSGVFADIRKSTCGVPFRPVTFSSGQNGLEVHGLTACKSVWACDVCSAKITRDRAANIRKLGAVHAARKGTFALLTFTLWHNNKRSLIRTLGDSRLGTGLLGAYQHFTTSRFWDKYVRGSVFPLVIAGFRSLEVTWSPLNGFHPHLHLTCFIPRGKKRLFMSLKANIKARWIESLQKVGEWGDLKSACDVRSLPLKKIDYAVKIGAGLGHELADSGAKLAADGHFTISQMREAFVGDDTFRKPLRDLLKGLKGRYFMTSFGRTYLRELSESVLDEDEQEQILGEGELLFELDRFFVGNQLINPNFIADCRQKFADGGYPVLFNYLLSLGLTTEHFLLPHEVQMRDDLMTYYRELFPDLYRLNPNYFKDKVSVFLKTPFS